MFSQSDDRTRANMEIVLELVCSELPKDKAEDHTVHRRYIGERFQAQRKLCSFDLGEYFFERIAGPPL